MNWAGGDRLGVVHILSVGSLEPNHKGLWTLMPSLSILETVPHFLHLGSGDFRSFTCGRFKAHVDTQHRGSCSL